MNVSPQQARTFLEMLDLVDETQPSRGDVFVLKGVLRRLIALLATKED